MPGDVPVASVAVGMGGPRNAGLFAVQILGTADRELRQRFREFKQQLVNKIAAKNDALQRQLADEPSRTD
jgi:5-(carboxyamino)imidazole ribonucleotide mutase